jgi:hypothetical protein
MAYNIGVANFVRTWFSTWQWSDLPVGELGLLLIHLVYTYIYKLGESTTNL